MFYFMQGTGAMKAAVAFDFFANVTHGFASLLIGGCFEDVTVSNLSISQRDTPTALRVPNPDTSSVTYSDNLLAAIRSVPSAAGLTTGGSKTFMWIVLFMIVTCLGTCTCACVGIKFVGKRDIGAAVPVAQPQHAEDLAQCVDGSVLDTPKSSVYSKENRMFSRDPASGARETAAQKRAALNACSIPTFDRMGGTPTEDFELLSSPSGSSFSRSSEQDGGDHGGGQETKTRNPMFNGSEHAPRLSALDFGMTMEGKEEDDPSSRNSFWHRRNRKVDDR